MIQRVLFSVLKQGIEEITADLTILDDLFSRQYGLSATEVAAIKEHFVEKPPNLTHGYPHQDNDFPLYAIILGSETEDEHFIGDHAGMIDDKENPDFGADCLAALWRHTFQILVFAEHPDVTTYYYEIAKSILLEGTDSFDADGIFEIHMSGMDLAPDPRYIPEHLFARQLTFECKREFQRVDLETKLGKAFQVSGIAVDKSGSSSDVGLDKTGVVPFQEEPEGPPDIAL